MTEEQVKFYDLLARTKKEIQQTKKIVEKDISANILLLHVYDKEGKHYKDCIDICISLLEKTRESFHEAEQKIEKYIKEL